MTLSSRCHVLPVMITYLALFSVAKLTMVLAQRIKTNPAKTIQTALTRQKVKFVTLEEEGGGGLVWSVQPADHASMHKLLSLEVSRFGVIRRMELMATLEKSSIKHVCRAKIVIPSELMMLLAARLESIDSIQQRRQESSSLTFFTFTRLTGPIEDLNQPPNLIRQEGVPSHRRAMGRIDPRIIGSSGYHHLFI